MSFTLRAYLPALFFLTQACGATPPPDFGPFASYAQSFLLQAALHGKSPDCNGLVMRWERLEAPFVGYCYPGGSIAIDPVAWKALSEGQRELLVFHELGHCAMSLGHRTDRPAIMNPSILLTPYYAKYRESLLNDFFASYE